MGYIVIEDNTGDIKSLFSWNDSELPSNYPVNEGCSILEVDEELFDTIRGRFLEIKHLRIIDKNATKYQDMIEESTDILDMEQEISELKEYLSSTDFYYLRQFETGEPVDDEITSKRKQARERLRELGL